MRYFYLSQFTDAKASLHLEKIKISSKIIHFLKFDSFLAGTKYYKNSESLEFPLLIKYHFTVTEKNKLVSVYAGITYSLLGIFKGFDNHPHHFYDPYHEEELIFY